MEILLFKLAITNLLCFVASLFFIAMFPDSDGIDDSAKIAATLIIVTSIVVLFLSLMVSIWI